MGRGGAVELREQLIGVWKTRNSGCVGEFDGDALLAAAALVFDVDVDRLFPVALFGGVLH